MLPTNVRERRVLRRGLAPLRHGERREVRHVPRRPRQPVAAARDESSPGRTLDDLREAVTTLEDAVRTARRLLGSAHPLIVNFERSLREARARETTIDELKREVEKLREQVEQLRQDDEDETRQA